MIDLPPRRYGPNPSLAPTTRWIGILAFVAGAVMALSSLRSDPIRQIGAGIFTIVFGGLGVWALVAARRTARYGFEHGPLGFRNPMPNAEWRPWSEVDTVRVRRGEVVLLDDAGRRMAGFSIVVEGFQDALDEVMAACPSAVPVPPLPVTFDGRAARGGRIRWVAGVLSALVFAVGGGLLASYGGAPGALAAFAVVTIGVLAGLAPLAYAGYRKSRDAIIETTVDAAGITIRTREDDLRIEREAVRDVRVVWGDPDWRERRARQRWWERRERQEPGYRVVVRDRAATLVTIAPPSVDAVALYAAVRAMRAGSGDR